MNITKNIKITEERADEMFDQVMSNNGISKDTVQYLQLFRYYEDFIKDGLVGEYPITLTVDNYKEC